MARGAWCKRTKETEGKGCKGVRGCGRPDTFSKGVPHVNALLPLKLGAGAEVMLITCDNYWYAKSYVRFRGDFSDCLWFFDHHLSVSSKSQRFENGNLLSRLMV